MKEIPISLLLQIHDCALYLEDEEEGGNPFENRMRKANRQIAEVKETPIPLQIPFQVALS